MKMTLNEEIEYLQSGDWYDKARSVLPNDEYLKLGWAIGDILETLELLRSLAPKPETNADVIRRMSDEELADLFADWDFCSDVCSQQYSDNPLVGKCPENCKEQVLEWLRQPVEVDT